MIGLLRTSTKEDEKEETNESRKRRNVPLRRYLYLIGIILVLAALFIAFVVIWDDARDSRTKEKADAALRVFKVEHQRSVVDQGQVNQTLAELQEAYQILSDELPEPIGESQITIQTYRNLSEYRIDLGIKRSFGAVRCTLNDPIIYIPLEEKLNILTENDESRTPMHEMVHAVMCQALGQPWNQKGKGGEVWFGRLGS